MTAPNPVAILGMSGDPAHMGHLDAARRVHAMGYPRVVWMVTPQNPYKPNQPSAFEHRMALALLLAAPHPWLEVSDFEGAIHMPGEDVRTHTMLTHYRRLYPRRAVTFVMGGDNWRQFHTWGNYAQIVAMAGLLVIPRDKAGGLLQTPAAQTLADLRDPRRNGVVTPGHWRIAPVGKPHGASSSGIREALKHGRDTPWLTPEQRRYILENNLYQLGEPSRA